jgi:glycosyltransferase involved in cell wall biosynthesis
MSDRELVVLSHLQWTFVWQRPQHLISRLARHRRTWFVEQPWACDVDEPRLQREEHGDVTRIWFEVPAAQGRPGHVGFDHPLCAGYPAAVRDELGANEERTAWLYTPMALDLAGALEPKQLVYDVMDDLAAFEGAPAEMRLRHLRALRSADVVFTGGRSLHRGVLRHRTDNTHVFPSGVEPDHFAPARRRRGAPCPPVAGYVGVIDERVDLGLVRHLAEALPDWEIRMVGPVSKIDPTTLPRVRNIRYAGPQPYAVLPQVLAGFDVALMPFALNQATRSISPTKTLEYLAAGLPVVSTRVPDVVQDYGRIVDLRDDAPGFAAACRQALPRGRIDGDAGVQAVLARQHWDAIAARMDSLLQQASTRASRSETA